MGGKFIARTSVPITELNRVRPDHRIAFSIEDCCDIPLGVPVDLIADERVAGKGVVEFIKITATHTQGQVRVLRDEEVLETHAAPPAFVHNYILWPDGPFGDLRPSAHFETLKDKQRRYPIGVPIDLALGRDFQIVASVVVHAIAISPSNTNVSGEVLLVYSAEERKLLTSLNQRREAENRALKNKI